ncbi:cytochrome c1 [Algimonas porphyrae]|uniref:Cytochrome c1 n=1 Tax=Algimonas porphyrae TaxID=1128113 RepID=A0ABQ5V1V8_9PROT|nr:cytochrome c1 [Algimonas porphyrae]GLQ21543.1 ubiquinol cytochrome C oxidoreductase [Algimonas porphyrae]
MAFKTVRNLIIVGGVAVATATGIALAAGGSGPADGYKMVHKHWHWSGFNGTYDQEAMQRGFQIYEQVCRSCHNLDHLAFRHLGDEGGPFYDYKYPNPNDNPLVKNIAAQYEVTDLDPEDGSEVTRAAVPADMFPSVYTNAIEARSVNNGALPPDLSLIVKARNDGANYLYNLMLAYDHPQPEGLSLSPGQYYNPVKEGSKIAMAPQLQPQVGLFEYQSDTEGQNPPEATIEQMAADLTEFLAWSADPKLAARKSAGLMSMVYLLILAVLLWLSYKRLWRRLKPSED